MTTIYVEYGTDNQKIEALKTALDDVAKVDANWNGVNFQVDFDETVWIDTQDEINGTQLLHSTVYPVLNGDQECDVEGPAT